MISQKNKSNINYMKNNFIDLSPENISFSFKVMILAILVNIILSLLSLKLPYMGSKFFILKQWDSIISQLKINSRRLFSSSFVISLIIFISLIFVKSLDLIPFLKH